MTANSMSNSFTFTWVIIIASFGYGGRLGLMFTLYIRHLFNFSTIVYSWTLSVVCSLSRKAKLRTLYRKSNNSFHSDSFRRDKYEVSTNRDFPVRAQAGDIFCVLVIYVHPGAKMGTMLGVTSHPGGSRNTPSLFMLQKPENNRRLEGPLRWYRDLSAFILGAT